MFGKLTGKAAFFRFPKQQVMVLGTGENAFPIRFDGEDQAEMAGIDAPLGGEGFVADVGYDLMIPKVQNHRLGGFPPHGTAEAFDVELFGFGYVVDGDGKVEKRCSHGLDYKKHRAFIVRLKRDWQDLPAIHWGRIPVSMAALWKF